MQIIDLWINYTEKITALQSKPVSVNLYPDPLLLICIKCKCGVIHHVTVYSEIQ